MNASKMKGTVTSFNSKKETTKSFNKSKIHLTKTFETETKRSKMNSRFFKLIFGDNASEAANARQTSVVKAQIGLDEVQDVDEIELEELIIMKALKDYNCSKFSQDQLTNIDGIINDVFQNKDIKSSEYSCLSELVKASFDTMKLDYNQKLETKAFQLYEITQVKSGCIVLGDFMSGKTTLINLLAAALNRAS